MGQSRRIRFLDELRGLCIVLMVFYHAFFVIGYLFEVSFAKMLFDFFEPIQPFFAGLFVMICGISCQLSHSNLKRGILLAIVAGFLSLVMWCAVFWGVVGSDSYVWFGILHCLATCILLYVLFKPTLQLLPPWLGILLSGLLFVCCWHVPFDAGGFFGIPGIFEFNVPQASANDPWLYAFGLCPVFDTADYFPLIPWFFCFLIGTYVGVWAKQGKFPKTLYRSRLPWLAAIGRHTLLIYLLHQPVIYLLCFTVDTVISRFF